MHFRPRRVLPHGRAALAAWAVLPVLATAAPLAAQSTDAIARERRDLAEWLETAPNSPLAATAQQPIGTGLTLGRNETDLPLPGVAEHRLVEKNARVTLEGPEGPRPVPRGLPFRLGRYTLTVDGPPGRAVVTVFGPARKHHAIEHYPIDGRLIFIGQLIAPEHRATVRLLGLDGIEVEATEAGSVLVPLGNRITRLRVRRLPISGEESELEIYFRDSTNGAGSYPAGRFVALIPTSDGRYRLDFNRARNPFCAYSSAYACPAPWQGNVLPAPVQAGEQYQGGGLEGGAAPR